jgi:tRNA threonylcarbamoyladenosine biosynthesis protein TsaE
MSSVIVANPFQDPLSDSFFLGQYRITSVDDWDKIMDLMAAHMAAHGVLLLGGELGAGKTTFVRRFLKFLGYQGVVPSPSFTLAQHYVLPKTFENKSKILGSCALGGNDIKNPISLWHVDLYRLNDPDPLQLEELGIMDMWQELCIMEWPQRLGTLRPENYLWGTIDFFQDSPHERIFSLWTNWKLYHARWSLEQ